MSSQSVFEKVMKGGEKDNILIETRGSVRYIVLNRPDRSNAVTIDMLFKIIEAVNQANKDPAVKFIVLYGKGKSFCSGNDLSNFQNPDFMDMDRTEVSTYFARVLLQNYGKAFINSDKPLFAVVHGRVLGMAFTVLGHFDKIFAVKGSTFRTPFVVSGQGPQLCSSHTFPKLFGKLGEQIVMYGKQVSGEELQKTGFLKTFNSFADAMKALEDHIKFVDSVDFQTLLATRRLLRLKDRELLLKINEQECQNLVTRWSHPQFLNIMMRYFSSIKQPKL